MNGNKMILGALGLLGCALFAAAAATQSNVLVAVVVVLLAAGAGIWMGRSSADAVDPWALQYKLMDISAQTLPATPHLNKDALLYLALILEETAETFDAVRSAWMLNTACWHNLNYAEQMDDMRTRMHAASKTMRGELAKMQPFARQLTMLQAKPILDGTTDIAVVNSGFSLAAGLPGAQAYREVAGSNLSKANPTTGVIDKDPSGKWIKGINYREPDLLQVLATHQAENGHHE